MTALCAPGLVAHAQTTEASGSQNQGLSVAPRGYVQLDWRGYPDWPTVPGTGRLVYDTFEVRRARVGVDGRWGRRFSYEVTVDPQDLDDTFVRDAYGRWRFSRQLEVQAGQFKIPGSREFLTSGRNLDFMERAALAQFAAPGRDIGAMVAGDLGRVEYQTGVFAGDGRGRASRAELTSASRVVWDAVPNVDIAGTLTVGRTSAVDADPANGIEGRTSNGYRFFDRVYVDGRRTRWGGDVEWSPGPWRVTAEALRVSDARDGQGLEFEDLPGVETTGFSVSLVRQLGRRGQGRPRARFKELDLGIRFDSLTFDDSGPDTGLDSTRLRATNIRARGARSLALSASWQPTGWSRILVNGGLDTFTEARSAPEAGRKDGYWTAGTRFQLELP
jgi:phosphate-selective porin